METIDPSSGAVSGPRPVEDGSGRRLTVTALLVVDGSLWAEGFWARPSNRSGYLATDEKAVAKVDPGSGRVVESVAVPNRLSIEAGHASSLWLADPPSPSVYEIARGGRKVGLAARLRGRGTIVGSVGSALWVAESHGIIAQFRLPAR